MTAATEELPRRFRLLRHEDPSGVSGTGIVAHGIEWTDGTLTLRWRGPWPTTTVWDYGVEALLAIHGHGGKTVIEWIDPAPGTAWEAHDDPTIVHAH